MKNIKIIALLILALNFNFSFADSPLTSTPFSTAYSTDKNVKIATEKGYGKKTEKALGSSKTSSLDKLLIINAFSWGDENSAAFEKYLISKRKGLTSDVFTYLTTVSDDVPQENDQTKLLSADDLMSWAYLKAMSDYNNPQLAIRAAYLAYSRDTKNMAYGTVLGLIASQKAFDRDWCDVYQTANKMIVEMEYENNQLNEAAVKIIMDYIGLYKQDCGE